VFTDTRERATAIQIAAGRIGRQRRRDHVLAEPPVDESAARTLATDLAPVAREHGAVILRSRDLRQRARRFEAEDLHLALAVISLAAREHLLAR